ncbi:aldehyde dehydrogenase [Nonlabens xiamenensis]|uniref:aldehyde dehydrogenase n=1 Tax=Nonlabens xiamenensis TaxID=2341043 RepID=UPI000F61207B|nr:aldehyde dehydrogenase [Nonlabens xiamenensis]
MEIPDLYQLQQTFFKSRKSLEISYRVNSLQRLQNLLSKREEEVYQALAEDLGKSKYETFLTEYQVVLSELKKFIYHTKNWSKPQKVKPSLFNFPSHARRYPEPYGNTLIISPWNYPFQLALAPLIGAVAAGNTVILKPSEFSSATSTLLNELISEAFEPGHVSVVLGDATIAQQLTGLQWDYIFFTGSPGVGKKIYQAAAQYLTPVTLELGGKNPCVIDPSAPIPLTARRIVWGKFLNAGQTCIAPDYLLVHHTVKDQLIECIKKEVEKAFGTDPKNSPDFPRIIREAHFDQLVNYLEGQTCLMGGNHDKQQLYFSPSLLDEPNRESAVMQGEIFGPILPVISYKDQQEVVDWIESYPKPLGGYCFSKDKKFQHWFIHRFSFGGGVINDSIVQFVNDRVPFGGVGNSGIGSYHGKKTFDTFSHYKGVIHRGTWLDLPVRYAPYKGKFKKMRSLLTWL